MQDIIGLARGLQNSNIPEVAELATCYISLAKKYDELQSRFIILTGEKVMEAHKDLLQRLADSGD